MFFFQQKSDEMSSWKFEGPSVSFIIHVLIGRTGDYDPSVCVAITLGMGTGKGFNVCLSLAKP